METSYHQIGHSMKILKLAVYLLAIALSSQLFLVTTASVAAPQTGTPATATSAEVLSDPNAEYVSVEEAKEIYDFAPLSLEESQSGLAYQSPTLQKHAVSPLWSWWGCDWHGKADYPHITRGEAAVHGYWIIDGGKCPSTATVTVDLQALLCSGLYGCVWITQTSATVKDVKPGSGTGRWATPHKACRNSNSVAWRGTVDTDLTNFADPLGKDYGPAKNLACSPA